MSSRGFNSCTLAGNVAADPVVKGIILKDRKDPQKTIETYVRTFTMYVDRVPKRHDKDNFTVEVSVWENSQADRVMEYVSKGVLLIVTGAIDTSPYLSNDGTPRAGLKLKASSIFLDSSSRDKDSSSTSDIDEPPF
jgi:single-strand DNA-binding protein